jgi:hypothetical protein
MKTSVRAAVEVMFQRRRQCLIAGYVLINRGYTHRPGLTTSIVKSEYDGGTNVTFA